MSSRDLPLELDRVESGEEELTALAPFAAARPLLLQALRLALGTVPAPGVTPLTSAEADGFLHAVRRHRLAALLAPCAEGLGLNEDAAALLRQEARRQQRAALPLITTAVEVHEALRRAGLRVLLLKGPALALQTTGQAWSRGGGDVDLLVEPADLPAAMAVLEGLGFEDLPGEFPRDLRSFWGRYARWVGHEISLRRGRRQWIDLHWALSNVRRPLPGFDAAWRERQELVLNGCVVPTLSLRHAFLAACVQAAADEWMELRHLVDITRLAAALPEAERGGLRRLRPVQLSCAVAYDATGAPVLLAFSDPRRRACRWAIARARWTQERPPRTCGDGAWHPGHWLRTVISRARLSHAPLEWLRVLARYSLTPAALNDRATGQDRGLGGLLQARARRLGQRFQEGRRPPADRPLPPSP